MNLSVDIGLSPTGPSIVMAIRGERQETGGRQVRNRQEKRKGPMGLILDAFLPAHGQAMATPDAAVQFGGDWQEPRVYSLIGWPF